MSLFGEDDRAELDGASIVRAALEADNRLKRRKKRRQVPVRAVRVFVTVAGLVTGLVALLFLALMVTR